MKKSLFGFMPFTVILVVFFVVYISVILFDRTAFSSFENKPINVTRDMVNLLTNIGQQDIGNMDGTAIQNKTIANETKDKDDVNNIYDNFYTNISTISKNLSHILNAQQLLLQKLQQIEQQQNAASSNLNEDLVIKDSESIFLQNRELPEGSLMHIYQVNPFVVSNTTTILSKLPCDDSNLTPVNILAGKMPNFKILQLNYISEFSNPGSTCYYQSDIVQSNSSIPISEFALYNNSTDDIDFPATTVVHVGMVVLNKTK